MAATIPRSGLGIWTKTAPPGAVKCVYVGLQERFTPSFPAHFPSMPPPGTPRIYGPDGRPAALPRRDLARRTAPPAQTGFRRPQQWHSVVAGLTPGRLRAIYQAISTGAWCPDFFELAEEIEERDLHYRGVLQQRRLRSAGAPIDVAAASAAAADRALADEVRERVVQGPEWHGLLLSILDALGKGVSCVEIVWRYRGGRWEPGACHRIDPRWLVWDDADGETPLLMRDRGDAPAGARRGLADPAAGAFRARADPLAPGKFIYHAHRSKSGLPTRGGLAFSVATMYLLKSVAVRDWWAFAELYGVPVRVGKYGPTATEADVRTLVDALAALAADAGAAIPESMSIDVLSAAGGGEGGSRGLFGAQADWCDAQVSKAVVGQTMTADDGSSRAQAEVHADVRDDLVRDDVRQVCETLSRTLVRWYCELNHRVRPAGWPRLVLPPPPADLDVPAIVSAVSAGLRVPAAWLRERLGIPEPKAGEEVLTGMPAGADPAGADGPATHADRRAGLVLAAAEEAADRGLDGLLEPLRQALAGAETPAAFVAAAEAAGAPPALAADVARQAFEARVDAEVDGDAGGAGDGEG